MISKTKLINNSTKSSYKLINNNSKKLINRLKNNNKFIRNNTLSKLVGNSSNILINSSNKTIINKRNNNNQNQSSSSNGKNDNKFKLNKSISRLGIRSNNKASDNNENSSSNNTHIRVNKAMSMHLKSNKNMSILGMPLRLNKAMSMLGMHLKSHENMSMLGMHLKSHENMSMPGMPLRLNKAMSILGICSRRDADKYIANKSVYVNNKLVEKLGTKVKNGDIITVNGINYTFTNKHKTRVWIYNKPSGLVTTHKDEKGRVTVFDSISDMIGQRVISVGRLDLNSEGLLLLTNSGDFARYAESPNTGWERHYRVRFFGEVNNNIIHELVKLKNNNRVIFSGEVNNNKLNSNKLNQFKNNELQNNTENVNDNITDKIDKPNNILVNNNECKIMQLKNNEIHTKHLMSNLSGEDNNNIDVNKLNKSKHNTTEINNNNPTASVDLNTNDINICKTHKLENNKIQNNNSMFSVDVNNNTLDSHKTNQLKNNEIQNNLTNTMSLNDDTNKTNLEKVIEIISNGITIDGIHYAPIKITNISNNKGLNKWCTCVLKEGKNREIRKIFNYFGLQVNKLIRIKYGPYELGDLKTGEIKEVEDKIEQ